MGIYPHTIEHACRIVVDIEAKHKTKEINDLKQYAEWFEIMVGSIVKVIAHKEAK